MTDAIAVDHTTQRTEHYDLVILGSGSGNSVSDEDLLRWRVAMIEPGVFGGTCLNRGCIPSKMFVYAAEVAHRVTTAAQYGVHATLDSTDWVAIRDRVFGRIDPIAAGGRAYRGGLPNTDLYEAPARFVGERTLQVGAVTITADRVVLAAGSRPSVPDVPGIDDVPHVTSDEVMRLDERPARLVILGGGFVATEMGHVFDGLGSEVTIVNRGATLCSTEDDEVSEALTVAYRARGITIHGNTRDVALSSRDGDPVVLTAMTPDGPVVVAADLLLVATGRVGNHDTLDLPAGGVEVGADGRPVVDAQQRTSADGVWSLGDLSSQHWLKHIANAEARTVAHNIRHMDAQVATELPNVPSAVFGSPQVASVGARERDLVAAGTPYLVARRDYGGTAYGWAMEDTTSFVKVLVDPETRLLLGVHAIGPEASLVIQPLIQAMALGTDVDRVARDVIYIHPALSEVVENVLLDLPASPVR
ncbi:MAG: mycothione reductase [Myxococcota bacterium]|jgi:mycothione reductase